MIIKMSFMIQKNELEHKKELADIEFSYKERIADITNNSDKELLNQMNDMDRISIIEKNS